MYRGEWESGGHCICDYFPVFGQGLCEGVLDYWRHDYCDQFGVELDKTDPEGADWRALMVGWLGVWGKRFWIREYANIGGCRMAF